jgi:hypothetical protein
MAIARRPKAESLRLPGPDRRGDPLRIARHQRDGLVNLWAPHPGAIHRSDWERSV